MSRIRYEVTTYRKHQGVKVESLGCQQGHTIAVDQFDFMLSNNGGMYGYRNVDGHWIERPMQGAGLGPRTVAIVQALQLNPGVLLKPTEVIDLIGCSEDGYENNAISSRLRVIRKSVGECGTTPRFFLSQRRSGFRLGWARQYSWIWIERID